MRTEYLRIAPDLDILVNWSYRMGRVFHQRYKSVIYNFASRCQQAPASEQLRREYDQWCRAQEAAFFQIKRFFTLTNSLPVVGDCLIAGGNIGGESLRIEKRTLFSMPNEHSMLVVYEMYSEEWEEAGDFEQDAPFEEHE